LYATFDALTFEKSGYTIDESILLLVLEPLASRKTKYLPADALEGPVPPEGVALFLRAHFDEVVVDLVLGL